LGTALKAEENLFTQDNGKLMGYSTPYYYFLRHTARHNKWVENNKSLTEKAMVMHMSLQQRMYMPIHLNNQIERPVIKWTNG
jgi:hypothetical protein